MFRAVVLGASMPQRGPVRIHRNRKSDSSGRSRVQRREATDRFVTGRTDVWDCPARRTCSTVTQWRTRGQLIEVEIDGLISHGCTG